GVARVLEILVLRGQETTLDGVGAGVGGLPEVLGGQADFVAVAFRDEVGTDAAQLDRGQRHVRGIAEGHVIAGRGAGRAVRDFDFVAERVRGHAQALDVARILDGVVVAALLAAYVTVVPHGRGGRAGGFGRVVEERGQQ